MTELDFKNSLDDNVLREECFCKYDCIHCANDFDVFYDSDGCENEYETWWCEAQEGDFCPRIESELKYEK